MSTMTGQPESTPGKQYRFGASDADLGRLDTMNEDNLYDKYHVDESAAVNAVATDQDPDCDNGAGKPTSVQERVRNADHRHERCDERARSTIFNSPRPKNCPMCERSSASHVGCGLLSSA
jgi:hypothetical protein